MIKRILFVILLFPLISGAQTFELPEVKRYEKISFKLINNLIVVPVKVNGTALSFILDSGVSKPILFNLSQDSIDLKNVSEIKLKGLGEGESVKALSSMDNVFELKSIKNNSQQIYVVLDKELNFSPKLGIPVHGIIGYDFFKNFIVEVNYGSKFLKVYNPDRYKYKSGKNIETLKFKVTNKKAYVTAKAIINEDKEIPVKLLLDTGSSDAVWLFENEEAGIAVPNLNFSDFLGKGLSGNIYGRRTKINQLNLGMYKIKNTKTAFPDSSSIKGLKKMGARNGSIGGEVLKRFNWVIDYPNEKISLKRNSNYKKPFWFNTSGIGLQHSGMRYVGEKAVDKEKTLGIYNKKMISTNNTVHFDNEIVISLVPQIVISDIRDDSPAKLAGLKVGDVILAVNKKDAHNYKLQELTLMVDDVPGKKVSILIERRGERLLFNLRIKKIF